MHTGRLANGQTSASPATHRLPRARTATRPPPAARRPARPRSEASSGAVGASSASSRVPSKACALALPAAAAQCGKREFPGGVAAFAKGSRILFIIIFRAVASGRHRYERRSDSADRSPVIAMQLCKHASRPRPQTAQGGRGAVRVKLHEHPGTARRPRPCSAPDRRPVRHRAHFNAPGLELRIIPRRHRPRGPADCGESSGRDEVADGARAAQS